MKKNLRDKAFVPQLLIHLTTHGTFECKFSDLPKSYQEQPYNLAAKTLARGGIKTQIFFNKEQDTFTILRLANPHTPTICPKNPKSKRA